MKYCVYCERKVYPMKKINWFILILMCCFTMGFWLFLYIPFCVLIKRPRCPMCGGFEFGPEFVTKKPDRPQQQRVEAVATKQSEVPQQPDRTREFVEDKLKILADMHSDGLITDEEYAKRKSEILEKMV